MLRAKGLRQLKLTKVNDYELVFGIIKYTERPYNGIVKIVNVGNVGGG